MLSSEQDPKENDVFYKDDLGQWMKTGDQAIMAENGEVTLVGRVSHPYSALAFLRAQQFWMHKLQSSSLFFANAGSIY